MIVELFAFICGIVVAQYMYKPIVRLAQAYIGLRYLRHNDNEYTSLLDICAGSSTYRYFRYLATVKPRSYKAYYRFINTISYDDTLHIAAAMFRHSLEATIRILSVAFALSLLFIPVYWYYITGFLLVVLYQIAYSVVAEKNFALTAAHDHIFNTLFIRWDIAHQPRKNKQAQKLPASQQSVDELMHSYAYTKKLDIIIKKTASIATFIAVAIGIGFIAVGTVNQAFSYTTIFKNALLVYVLIYASIIFIVALVYCFAVFTVFLRKVRPL